MMTCPACTNPAKSNTRFYVEPSFLSFKCQYCNTMLRGNLKMIFLDFFALAMFGLFIGIYVALFDVVQEYVKEFNIMTVPVLGVALIAFPVKWVEKKIGKYNRV